MKISAVLLLCLVALSPVATGCAGAVDESDSSEDALTDGKTVKLLHSSPDDGILKSTIAGGVAGPNAQRAAETILKVASWSQLKAGSTPIFSKVELVRDDKVALNRDATRKLRANVSVSSRYGDIKIPVDVVAKRTGNAINIKLSCDRVSVLFTTVLDPGGILMDLTLSDVAGGVKITGNYGVALQAGEENAPKMELLGPLYDWSKPLMKNGR